MKNIFVFLISLMTVATLHAQGKSGDADLDKRLTEYMQLNENLDFDKVMDYMHPKLFKIAPKEKLVAAMKAAFESEEMTLSMSGLAVTKAETTSFKAGASEYRKVEYKMTTSIRFNDTTLYEQAFIDQMTETFKGAFEEKKVVFDKKTKSFIVSGTDILYAIKDAGKPWLFLGFKKDERIIKMLFPQEVADHYGMLD